MLKQYNFIKKFIEKEGYRLLSKEWKNSKTKLELECDKGHKYLVIWGNFQHGKRCPICAGNKKLTIEFIKEEIEKEGYKLLSKEYKNNRTKLEVECPKRHKFGIRWNNFNQGVRCPLCARNKKLSYNYIKEQIEKEGYKLLSKEYKNNHTKLELECNKGHKYKVNYGHFQQGQRCFTCFINNRKLTYEYIKGKIEKEGYKLLSKGYKNAHTKLELECTKGHIFLMRWNNFRNGQRCIKCICYNNYSKGEKEVLEYIQSLTDTTIIENDRSQIINPLTNQFLELDIFLPHLKKAIEYNGTYWHSKKHQKFNDNQKVIQCKEKEIDLMVIKENDWINNKDVVINNIENFL